MAATLSILPIGGRIGDEMKVGILEVHVIVCSHRVLKLLAFWVCIAGYGERTYSSS